MHTRSNPWLLSCVDNQAPQECRSQSKMKPRDTGRCPFKTKIAQFSSRQIQRFMGYLGRVNVHETMPACLGYRTWSPVRSTYPVCSTRYISCLTRYNPFHWRGLPARKFFPRCMKWRSTGVVYSHGPPTHNSHAASPSAHPPARPRTRRWPPGSRPPPHFRVPELPPARPRCSQHQHEARGRDVRPDAGPPPDSLPAPWPHAGRPNHGAGVWGFVAR